MSYLYSLVGGRYDMRRQQGVVAGFRKGEINLLISTSVGEEGLNIKKCQVVIRFDGVIRYGKSEDQNFKPSLISPFIFLVTEVMFSRGAERGIIIRFM
jgi:hypothetical protein